MRAFDRMAKSVPVVEHGAFGALLGAEVVRPAYGHWQTILEDKAQARRRVWGQCPARGVDRARLIDRRWRGIRQETDAAGFRRRDLKVDRDPQQIRLVRVHTRLGRRYEKRRDPPDADGEPQPDSVEVPRQPAVGDAIPRDESNVTEGHSLIS